MARASFFSAPFKAEVKRAVGEVERQTSAEIVVAVRPNASSYRHVDFAVGSVVALAVLCVFLYHPEPFEFTYLPLELAGAWIAGAMLSLGLTPLRRSLASKKLKTSSADLAASAAFSDCGVYKTRARTGILVFVSAFERRGLVRADVGVPTAELGEKWTAWTGSVDAAARRLDAAAFLAALRQAGPLLADKLPRAADDVNELADDVSEAA
jgi:putative membrane protein